MKISNRLVALSQKLAIRVVGVKVILCFSTESAEYLW